jgi:hypothetical protein
MKMSIIDQRPIHRTAWYSRVRSLSHPARPVCVATSMTVRPTSLSIGKATLAKNTSAASGYMPDDTTSRTPPRIVLGVPSSSCITVSTGFAARPTVQQECDVSRTTAPSSVFNGKLSKIRRGSVQTTDLNRTAHALYPSANSFSSQGVRLPPIVESPESRNFWDKSGHSFPVCWLRVSQPCYGVNQGTLMLCN